MKPHQYQEEAIQHLCDLYARGAPALVNGSDMGTGKTLKAVEVMKRLGSPATLAVVPKVTIPSWHRHAAEQGVELSALNWEMVRTGRTDYWNGKEWHPEIKFLIFDEVHRAMGRDSKNSELVRQARRQNIRALAMSATLADTPLEMDAIGYLLRLHDGYRPKTTLADVMAGREALSFNQWTAKHGCGLNKQGEWVFRGNPEKQRKEMAKIWKQIYPDCGVRVRIRDLPPGVFPETQVTAELYEMEESGRIEALYAQMAASIDALRKRAEGDFGSPAVEQLRERQEVELLKLPVFVELAKESVAAGRSVVIFVNFRQSILELSRMLNTDCIIDGTVLGDKRERNRLRFERNECREIICNGEAGGVGCDLDDVTGDFPRTVLISSGFNAKTERQKTGRTARIRSKSPSLVRYIFAAGTVEEGVQKSLARKLDNMDSLNDGDLLPNNLRISCRW